MYKYKKFEDTIYLYYSHHMAPSFLFALANSKIA